MHSCVLTVLHQECLLCINFCDLKDLDVVVHGLMQGIKESGIDVEAFITIGVSAALRQLLEFGLFHGDPHPGNIFVMRDGRIAYVDFGNVAELSQVNFYSVSKFTEGMTEENSPSLLLMFFA